MTYVPKSEHIRPHDEDEETSTRCSFGFTSQFSYQPEKERSSLSPWPRVPVPPRPFVVLICPVSHACRILEQTFAQIPMMLMLLLLLPRPADEDTADTRPRRMGRICKAACNWEGMSCWRKRGKIGGGWDGDGRRLAPLPANYQQTDFCR